MELAYIPKEVLWTEHSRLCLLMKEGNSDAGASLEVISDELWRRLCHYSTKQKYVSRERGASKGSGCLRAFKSTPRERNPNAETARR